MNRIETALPGVVLLEPRVFPDARGFFMETYSARGFAALGIANAFVQDNHSKSGRGTLRGLHYQLEHPQAKLCRVVAGAVLDVAVDIRRGSPTFGQHVTALLSAENKRQLFVPRGFAHGFVVLSDETEFLYKCDDFYAPGDEYCIAWDDPQLGIDWELAKWGIPAPLLSPKDEAALQLGQIPLEQLPLFSNGLPRH